MKIATFILTLSCAVLLQPQTAKAAAIETFSFIQMYGPLGDNLSGSFSGALEADGSIQLADLMSFSATFTINLGQLTGIEMDTYGLGDLKLFSIFPSANGANSSLDVFAGITTGIPGSICVGAAAAFGLCGQSFIGQSNNPVGVDHLRYAPNPFLYIVTSQQPVVNFIPPEPAAAPEPASLMLTGLAIPFLIFWRGRKRAAQ